MSKAYSLFRAFWLSIALLPQYFFTINYCSVDTFEDTCACTQKAIPITRVYTTPPIPVTRSQYGTVTNWRFLSKKSWANKHSSFFFWIDPSHKHVPLMMPTIAFNRARVVSFSLFDTTQIKRHWFSFRTTK